MNDNEHFDRVDAAGEHMGPGIRIVPAGKGAKES